MNRIQGSELLQVFSQAESSAQAEIAGLEGAVREQESRIAEANRERENVYVELASLYCEERESLAEELSLVSGELQRQFDAKRARREEIEGDIERAVASLKLSNETLAEMREKRDLAAREHELTRAKWEKVLAESEEVRDLQARLAQAEEQLKTSQEAEALLQEEARRKRGDYEADELFMHLYRGGYGGPDYRGSPFKRGVEAWFARRLGWQEQVRAYEVLLLIPGLAARRVAEASAGRKLLADRLDLRVHEHEREQGADVTRRQLETCIQAMETLGRRIEEEERRLESFVLEKRALESNTDIYVSRAKQAIKGMLAGEPVRQLRERAQRAKREQDLRLIERIEQSEAEVNQGREQIKRLRAERDQASSRMNRVRSLKRRFDSDYTATYDCFESTFDLAALLVSFQLGRLSETQFWGVVQESYLDLTPVRQSSFFTTDSSSWSGSSGGFDGGGFSGGGDCGGGGASFGGGD